MVRYRTHPSRLHTPIAVGTACVMIVSLSAGCGSDTNTAGANESPASAEKKSDNPAAQFTGSYDAVITTLTVNGKPPAPTDTGARPSTRKWVVQSTCDGPADGCMAIAADTQPGVGALTRDRMEFVGENGSWTRVVEPTRRDCTATATKKVVDEPWVALHSTTLKATGAGAATPITALSGTIENVQGGTCFAVTRGTIELRRTGELPANTKPLDRIPTPPAVTDPAGASLRGTYEFVNKVLRATPPSYAAPYRTGAQKTRLIPMCTRDGTRCVNTAAAAGGQAFGALSFRDGTYELTSTGPPYSCGGGRTGYSKQALRIRPTDVASGPATTATATSDIRYLGDCPGEVDLEVTLTRTGD